MNFDTFIWGFAAGWFLGVMWGAIVVPFLAKRGGKGDG